MRPATGGWPPAYRAGARCLAGRGPPPRARRPRRRGHRPPWRPPARIPLRNPVQELPAASPPAEASVPRRLVKSGLRGDALGRGAVRISVEEVEDDALAQAPLADLQGLAEQLRDLLEQQ